MLCVLTFHAAKQATSWKLKMDDSSPSITHVAFWALGPAHLVTSKETSLPEIQASSNPHGPEA